MGEGQEGNVCPQTPIFHVSQLGKTPSYDPILHSAHTGMLVTQATILLAVSFHWYVRDLLIV